MGVAMKQYVLLASLVVLQSCGDKKKGSSIGAPKVEPPVTRNMPAGMVEGTALLLDEAVDNVDENGVAKAEFMVAQIKQYLYPSNNGPSPLDRLKKIDERMDELNKRSEESAKACLKETAADYSLAASFPTDESFPMKLQCQEVLNETSEVAFGGTDANFYLIERSGSSSSEGIYVVAAANKTGDAVETWTVAYQANPSDIGASGPAINYMHVNASDTSGIEVTTAGTKGGYALACGVHFRSDKKHIYIKGQLSMGAGECSVAGAYCMDAVTLDSVDIANCTDASLDTFVLKTLTQNNVSGSASSTISFVDTKITGFTDFNKDQ